MEQVGILGDERRFSTLEGTYEMPTDVLGQGLVNSARQPLLSILPEDPLALLVRVPDRSRGPVLRNRYKSHSIGRSTTPHGCEREPFLNLGERCHSHAKDTCRTFVLFRSAWEWGAGYASA